MKDKFGYQKCDSEDLNPFDKCKPIDCELKYFGKRNFFQHPHCVPVKICENDPNVVYDYETNSCRNLKGIFSKDELKMLKAGIFSNFVEGTNETVDKVIINERKNVLKRVRRSLNESQTFANMILSSMLFIIKIVSIKHASVKLDIISVIFFPLGRSVHVHLSHDGISDLYFILFMHWMWNNIKFGNDECF